MAKLWCWLGLHSRVLIWRNDDNQGGESVCYTCNREGCEWMWQYDY